MPAPEGRNTVSHDFRVRYAETDAMGIVHHSSYIVWMEMGRTEFMRNFGFTYRELEEQGITLPVIEVGVRYRQPAFYDDELRITTWVEELSRVRLKLGYDIVRISDGKLLTEGHSLHAFVGPDGRPLRMNQQPEALAHLLSMVPQDSL